MTRKIASDAARRVKPHLDKNVSGENGKTQAAERNDQKILLHGLRRGNEQRQRI